MIRPIENGKFEIICETCGYSVSGFDSFKEAVEYKRENDWRSLKTSDGWEDVCSDCKEGYA